MHAEMVMIGTELLLGEIVDTNANRIAKALRQIGLDLYFKTTVGDNEIRITEVLNLALDRSDVVITSGGIGPTVDDVTRPAAANATGRKLVYSTELEAQIEALFRSYGREMAENNKRQAYIPEGALPLPNPVGTAPCFLTQDVRGRGFIISLPGVPRELDYMLENAVVPLLVERMGGVKSTKVRILRTCAVGESNVDRTIGDLMKSRNPSVGLAAHAGQTDIRITAKADNETEVEKLIATMESKIRARLGVAVYGVQKETVPEVVGGLLRERNLRLAIFDMLTRGQLGRELAEAGYGGLISTALNTTDKKELLRMTGLDSTTDLRDGDWKALAASVAESITPGNGFGLALLGPFEKNLTFITLSRNDGDGLTMPGLHFQDADYARRWFMIQGLDLVRRAILGQLSSPAD